MEEEIKYPIPHCPSCGELLAVEAERRTRHVSVLAMNKEGEPVELPEELTYHFLPYGTLPLEAEVVCVKFWRD